MANVIEMLEQMVETLSDTAQSEVVVGKEIKLGSATIIPLSRVSIGFGGGSGEGPAEIKLNREKDKKVWHRKGKGSGLGTGGSAKVSPVGVIIFTDDSVRVEEVPDIPEKAGFLTKILDKIPAIIEIANKKK
jgi:uncharacterized spore protein YtfJ